jgi:hypothetical protein
MANKYWKYKWRVYKTTWKLFLGHFDEWRKAVQPLAVSILSAACTVAALYIYHKSLSPNDIKIIAVSPIGGALLYALLILLFENEYAPYSIYQEKADEAHKLTFQDIELTPYKFPPNSGYGIGLKILSDKQFHITDIDPRIGSVRQRDDTNSEERHLPILIKEGMDFAKGKDIVNRRGFNKWASVSAIPVANWDEEHAWIVAEDGREKSNIFIEKDIVCRVVITIDGTVDAPPRIDLKLEQCTVICDLVYAQEKNGKIGVSMKIFARKPEFEA